MRSITYVATAIAGALVILSSHGVMAETAVDAKRMYNTYCIQCHGSKRDGKGINAAHMSVQPRDHTDADSMGDIPDDQLYTAIREGGLAVDKSILMPAWKSVLTDQQIQGLVSYLREVCQCGPGNNN